MLNTVEGKNVTVSREIKRLKVVKQINYYITNNSEKLIYLPNKELDTDDPLILLQAGETDTSK